MLPHMKILAIKLLLMLLNVEEIQVTTTEFLVAGVRQGFMNTQSRQGMLVLCELRVKLLTCGGPRDYTNYLFF